MIIFFTMYRSLAYLVFSSLIVQATMGQGNDIKPKAEIDVSEKQTKRVGSDEILSVSVKLTEHEEGSDGQGEIQVNFKITIEKDVVKVNGKLTEIDVLTSYVLEAEIVEHSKNVRTALVTVNVLVMRKDVVNGYKFFLEEQIMIVDNKNVEQVDVKLLTIHMDINGKEYDRTVETVGFEVSHIKHKTVKKFCGKDDPYPKEKVMDEPELPDERGLHHKKLGKSFCSKFHKLPLAARVSILVAVICVVVGSVMCCACLCCRKPKKVVYNIGNEEKPDFELEVEAEPLPEKLEFDDKQVLLA